MPTHLEGTKYTAKPHNLTLTHTSNSISREQRFDAVVGIISTEYDIFCHGTDDNIDRSPRCSTRFGVADFAERGDPPCDDYMQNSLLRATGTGGLDDAFSDCERCFR